ncbi:hypothetical protein [Sphingobacterium daejeonense]|uniref:hypothetical protein n=1 Tax=Sphingobacterium daejeonense TaxID=371142 RepID=UPI003D314CA4
MVNANKTADHVFEDEYKLMPIDTLKKYINLNNHLPEIPSDQDMKVKGLNIGDFQIDLLKKKEELTLYIIESNETIKR